MFINCIMTLLSLKKNNYLIISYHLHQSYYVFKNDTYKYYKRLTNMIFLKCNIIKNYVMLFPIKVGLGFNTILASANILQLCNQQNTNTNT